MKSKPKYTDVPTPIEWPLEFKKINRNSFDVFILNTCQNEKSVSMRNEELLESKNEGLKKENEFLEENSTLVLKQRQDVSVVFSTQAESIRKAMENIGAKDAYIQDLQTSMAGIDSLNMALVMNLKGVLGNLDDKVVTIKVDKGVVFIDISNKLLFKSGSDTVTDQAKSVLSKVVLILKKPSGH